MTPDLRSLAEEAKRLADDPEEFGRLFGTDDAHALASAVLELLAENHRCPHCGNTLEDEDILDEPQECPLCEGAITKRWTIEVPK